MGWLSIFNTPIFNLPWIIGDPMRPLDFFGAIIWSSVLVLQLLSMRFVYWDTDELAIRQHRFGSHKTVRYSEIVKVTAQAEWSSKPSQLKIRYVPNTSDAKVHRMYAAPKDMDGFVDVLRKHAPAAAIEF